MNNLSSEKTATSLAVLWFYFFRRITMTKATTDQWPVPSSARSIDTGYKNWISSDSGQNVQNTLITVSKLKTAHYFIPC